MRNATTKARPLSKSRSRIENNAIYLGPVNVPLEPVTTPDGRRWISLYEFEVVPESTRLVAVELEDDQYEPELRRGDVVFVVSNEKPEDLGKYSMALANPRDRRPILLRVAKREDEIEIYSMQKSADPSTPLRMEDYLWIFPVHSTQRTLWRETDL